jgi:hypothetical protein
MSCTVVCRIYHTTRFMRQLQRHEVKWPDEESFEADADTAISSVNQQV